MSYFYFPGFSDYRNFRAYQYNPYTYYKYLYYPSWYRQQNYQLGEPFEIFDVQDDPQAQLITDPQQLQEYSNLLQVPTIVPLIVPTAEEIQESYTNALPEPTQHFGSPEQYAGEGPGYLVAGSELIQRTIWLFGFKVPEFKLRTCHKVFKTPLGKFKIPYPCLYTRTSELHFWATVWYPRSIEEYLKQQINDCLIESRGAAKGAGVTAFVAALSGGPVVAAKAGLAAAFNAFKINFINCIQNIPLNVKRNVYYQVKWEQINATEWKRI